MTGNIFSLIGKKQSSISKHYLMSSEKKVSRSGCYLLSILFFVIQQFLTDIKELSKEKQLEMSLPTKTKKLKNQDKLKKPLRNNSSKMKQCCKVTN